MQKNSSVIERSLFDKSLGPLTSSGVLVALLVGLFRAAPDCVVFVDFPLASFFVGRMRS